ncbi:MAG: beta-ketoacyl-[acyl-carrier-protein] synthase family protein [Nitrospiraceae bacterium]|nr:beta-ketoacyl-[acyl-carrier-protein] synthase family protein [Nitrospiraceae bacterium]
MSRVLITGIGAVTPIGGTFGESWRAAVEGKTGVRPISRFDAAGIPWKMAGEIDAFPAASFLGQKEQRRTDPFVHYAVAAALMAAEDAGLAVQDGPRRSPLLRGGVLIGSSRGGISTIENALRSSLNGKNRLSAYLMPSTTVGMASSYVAQKLGIRGYCLGISNACASGANAVGEAFRMIKAGFRGPVIAGGTEAPLCRLCLVGYGTAGALSKKADPSASSPFDRSRDGFVLSEGACLMVLEEAESALARKAKVYAEIAGYGNSADAFHQTKPDSRGQIQAMREAIEEAGLSPGGIDYISAHGTATLLGDRVEAEAISDVLGERLPQVPVSALKSITGHMLAASGALEAACAAMAVSKGIVPPTVNLRQKDPGCGLNIVTSAEKAGLETALSNSFGFGGVNAVLVLKRFRG